MFNNIYILDGVNTYILYIHPKCTKRYVFLFFYFTFTCSVLNINNETRLKCITLNHHCGRRRFRWWCITFMYCVVTVNVEWFRWFYRCPSEHFSTSEIQLTSKTGFYILLFSVCVEITLIHRNTCWCLTDDIHWAGLSYDIWRHFYMRRFWNNTKQTITSHWQC